MKRSHRSELSTHGNAGDRFEGEYPVSDWHRGRAAEASKTCYAPSKYPTKQWPTEAQLELWCSLSREAHNCFVLAAEMAGSDELFAMNAARAMPRVAGSRSIAALNANQPPGANGNSVRDRVGLPLTPLSLESLTVDCRVTVDPLPRLQVHAFRGYTGLTGR